MRKVKQISELLKCINKKKHWQNDIKSAGVLSVMIRPIKHWHYPFGFCPEFGCYGVYVFILKLVFNFYRAVIESVLTFSLIVWFGSSTAQQRSQINNITRVASKIIGYDLPTIDEIYVSRLQKKGLKILKDPLHPARHLFTPLPSGRRLRAIQTKSTRFLNSTYCRIVHALNSSGVYASVFHSL